jgi:hypothetical protein
MRDGGNATRTRGRACALRMNTPPRGSLTGREAPMKEKMAALFFCSLTFSRRELLQGIIFERDVCSPINSKSTDLWSWIKSTIQPSAFPNPSRGDRGRRDSGPPRRVRVSSNADEGRAKDHRP